MKKKVSALAPWFGSNRLLAAKVGELLAGCEWVGVPFAGGMCELNYIMARSIVVGDLHRHLINLARVVADDGLRPTLVKRLRRALFHPDELDEAQEWCKANAPVDHPRGDLPAAFAYFVCVWMGRSHIAGTKDEFHGRLSTRWNGNGGDSNTRYRSAVRGLADFGRIGRRCSFSVMDAFEFMMRCEDVPENGVYCDPPFPGAGREYRHNAGNDDEAELKWHSRLAQHAGLFQHTRVVMRFYDHAWIRDLYPEGLWTWHRLTGGKKQSNDEAPEVLLVKNMKGLQ